MITWRGRRIIARTGADMRADHASWPSRFASPGVFRGVCDAYRPPWTQGSNRLNPSHALVL